MNSTASPSATGIKIAKFMPLAAAAFFLFACAAKTGPLYLHPAEYRESGYRQESGETVFEDKSVRVALGQVTDTEGFEKDPTLSGLFNMDFILLRMDIENKTNLEIVYNPSHTSLLAGPFDYKKPLDYTGLYEIMAGKGAGGVEGQLSSLKGKYYDTDTRVPAKGKVSRLLIFHPLDKDSRGRKAVIAIKELYVGSVTLSLSFPFKVRVREAEKTPSYGY